MEPSYSERFIHHRLTLFINSSVSIIRGFLCLPHLVYSVEFQVLVLFLLLHFRVLMWYHLFLQTVSSLVTRSENLESPCLKAPVLFWCKLMLATVLCCLAMQSVIWYVRSSYTVTCITSRSAYHGKVPYLLSFVICFFFCFCVDRKHKDCENKQKGLRFF